MATSGLSRVTVVAPRMRVDLALPSDVPFADLLPTLLGHAGADLADEPTARDGWTLSRLGGPPLDSSFSPAQLDVRDGELLYLRPRGDEAPAPVFDDVVDAVATAARERAGAWEGSTSRVFGITLAALALLGGAVLVLSAGPPQLPGGLIGLVFGAALLVGAVVLARAVGDPRAATVLALVALVYAATGGLLVFAGRLSVDRLGPPQLLAAVGVVVVFSAVAGVGLGTAEPVFLCVGLAAGAMLVAAGIAMVFHTSPVATAAVTMVLVLGTLPALPMLAYRLGRLPAPSVPAEREQLRQEEPAIDAAQTLQRADRADAFLAGLLGTVAAVGAVGSVVTATGGWLGATMSAVVGLTLMARARWFLNRTQRLPLLAAGLVALTAALVAAFAAQGPLVRLTAVFAATVVIGGVGLGFGLAAGRRPRSPLWGRTLDILEMLVILALVPLAVWVSGLYGWIRTIRG
jgi:type VII secretion integral membrane protein EccD